MNVCPTCHQTLRCVRLGVPMPQLKSDIFDSIKASGDMGITARELMFIHYERKERSPVTLRAHISQINDLLEETDFVIRNDGGTRHARWYLGKR